MRVFLVGFMGSGKSRVGRELAALIGLPFLDLDEYIEEQAGMTVRAIFEGWGEAYFRELERELLAALLHQPAFVLATGGGTPCIGHTMELLNQNGTTVFLDPPEEELYRRLIGERAQRPLLRDKADLRAFISLKLAERRPFYERADFSLPGSETPEKIARQIMQRLPSPTAS
jgi:shikimate kinase